MTHHDASPRLPDWPNPVLSRVPATIFSDPDIYARELEVFHYGPRWNLVGMECEVPEPGSFKQGKVGERQVIFSRDAEDEIHVVENRCAHRGSPVCWEKQGKASEFICPYHNWSYSLGGDLQGVPFQRGFKGHGGMPASFDKSQNGLLVLKSVRRGGAIWASFDQDAPDFDTHVGPAITHALHRIASKGEMEYLGCTRQLIPCNWKLWVDNSRDGYHATLLHTFLTKFDLVRADLPRGTSIFGANMQTTAYLKPLVQDSSAAQKEIRVMNTDLALRDIESVSSDHDEFGDNQNMGFQVFPSAMYRQHLCSPSYRQILPRGPALTEIVWSYYCYKDDSPEQRRLRLKQANLTGAAGFVTAEDGEILPRTHDAAAASPESIQLIELGGDSLDDPVGMIFENAIRAMYNEYRVLMGFPTAGEPAASAPV